MLQSVTGGPTVCGSGRTSSQLVALGRYCFLRPLKSQFGWNRDRARPWYHRGQESRAADSRGLVTIATKQTPTEIAKVIPIPCDLPHPIHLASAIAPPPHPV